MRLGNWDRGFRQNRPEDWSGLVGSVLDKRLSPLFYGEILYCKKELDSFRQPGFE